MDILQQTSLVPTLVVFELLNLGSVKSVAASVKLEKVLFSSTIRFEAPAALVITLAIPTSIVSAGGPKLDWPEDSTSEGKDCWVDGYDAGFAVKYDKDRADRCALEDDEQIL